MIINDGSPCFRSLSVFRFRAAVWLAVFVFLLRVNVGCNPMEFDDLADRAPVQVKDTPGELEVFQASAVSLGSVWSDEHSSHVLAIGGNGPDSIVTMKLSETGEISTKSGGETYEGNSIVTGLATITRAGDTPMLLAGVPGDGVVYLAGVRSDYYPMSEGIRLVANQIGLGAERAFGGSVAAANMGPVLGADAARAFWVVASMKNIFVFTNPENNSSDRISCGVDTACNYDSEDCEGFRPQDRGLTAGRLFSVSGEEEGREALAVGVPKKREGSGIVKLIYYYGDGSQTGTECNDSESGFLTKIIEAPDTTESSFGTSVLAVDLDGDGWDELVVGAPGSKKAYLYSIDESSRDATDVWEGIDPIAVLEPGSYEDSPRTFGYSLAALDLNGDGVKELVIGDPSVSIDGNSTAGRVHVFSVQMTSGPGAAVEELGVLQDAEPQKSKRFGKGIVPVTAGEPGGEGSGDAKEKLAVVSDDKAYFFLQTNM